VGLKTKVAGEGGGMTVNILVVLFEAVPLAATRAILRNPDVV
jgi:hypothetical protein